MTTAVSARQSVGPARPNNRPFRRAPTPAARLAAALTAGLALAGCTVGPDFQPPAADLAPFHNAAAVTGRPAAAAPPLDRWWTGFNDQQLVALVDQALAQNLDLAAALARLDTARAAARGAGARLLPAADLTGAVTPIHQSLESPVGAIGRHLPGYDRDQSLYDAGIAASWEIDLAGGLRRGVEAATADAGAAAAERLAVRLSVAAETADAYLQMRGDQARLALAQDQIITDGQLLALVRTRRANGAATDREVAQAEALLWQAQATVPPLRAALDGQMNRLDVLTGRQPASQARDWAAPAPIPAVPAVDAARPAGDLVQRRPDIIAAAQRLAAANARIGVATAEYYPKVSLSGLLGFESLEAGHLIRAATFQPSAVAGLRWRLFDFGRIDAEVAQAEGVTAAALAQYRQTLLRAAEDVENAFKTLVEREARNDRLAAEVEAQQRARDLARQSYLAGAVGLIDVLDADRELLVARDNLARGRADAARAAVTCYRALGGGW